jgi:predicted lipoprotein with Yx(FWY)xxD motif
MRPIHRLISFAGVATAALLVAACSAAATTPATSVLGATAVASMAPAASQAAASQAAGAFVIGVTNDPTLGAYLTGANGMTLYHLTADKADTSTCTATCATNWPPLTVVAGTMITPPTGATGTFSLITRSDGTTQVAYDHMPLYYYSGDSAAGDTMGQGFNGKWFVAPLSGSAGAAASSAATAVPPTAAPTKAPAKATPMPTIGGY